MFGNRLPIPSLTAALAVLLSGGCAHRKSIGYDEARSDLRAVHSLAAESELFIDFVLQGHATRRYAEEQTNYLKGEVARSLNKLNSEVPETAAEPSVRECQARLNELSHEISIVGAGIVHDDKNALTLARERTRKIQESLQNRSSRS